MRKSPIRHHVRQHQRTVEDGKTQVHDYMRGDGSAPQNLSDPRPRQSQHPTTNFIVHIRYTSLPTENFPVTASTYPEAIDLAMLARIHITPPTQVEVAKQ